MDRKRLNSLMSFSLMWNVFENNYFDDSNRLNPEGLLELATLSNKYIIAEEYLSFIHHFKNRYIDDKENGKTRFNNLQLRNKDESFVFQTLTNCSPPNHLLPTLFLISHRFRNNLFHGVKEPLTLHVYEKQFRTINKFLAKYIDDTINNSTLNKDRFYLNK